jgi:hypothetical protein
MGLLGRGMGWEDIGYVMISSSSISEYSGVADERTSLPLPLSWRLMTGLVGDSPRSISAWRRFVEEMATEELVVAGVMMDELEDEVEDEAA